MWLAFLEASPLKFVNFSAASDIEPHSKHHIILLEYTLSLTSNLPKNSSFLILVGTLGKRNDTVVVEWRVAHSLEAIGASRCLYWPSIRKLALLRVW